MERFRPKPKEVSLRSVLNLYKDERRDSSDPDRILLVHWLNPLLNYLRQAPPNRLPTERGFFLECLTNGRPDFSPLAYLPFPGLQRFLWSADLPARLQTAYAFLSVIIRGLKSLGRNHRNRGNLLLHRQHFPSQNQLPFSESQGFRSGLLQHIMVHRTHRLSKKYQFLAFLPGSLPATETNLFCSGFIINDHFQFVNSFFELFSKNFIMCPIWAVFWKNDPKKERNAPFFPFPAAVFSGETGRSLFPSSS